MRLKLIKTQISPFTKSLIHTEYRDQTHFFPPYHGKPSYHSHPEIELIYFIEGYGDGILGSETFAYSPGDMVLIGSFLPHKWRSDPELHHQNPPARSRAIISYINPTVFDQLFKLLDELEGVKKLLEQASKGVFIYGKTRDTVARKLMILTADDKPLKINSILEILHLISETEEKRFFLKESPLLSHTNSDRLVEVIRFINENLHEPITLKDAAEIACMTPPSFCRFFKSRTQTTFSQYLAERRIEHARKLLIEMDKPVSEIASLCGYSSNSHFGKIFKHHTGQSPYQYKTRVIGVAG